MRRGFWELWPHSRPSTARRRLLPFGRLPASSKDQNWWDGPVACEALSSSSLAAPSNPCGSGRSLQMMINTFHKRTWCCSYPRFSTCMYKMQFQDDAQQFLNTKKCYLSKMLAKKKKGKLINFYSKCNLFGKHEIKELQEGTTQQHCLYRCVPRFNCVPYHIFFSVSIMKCSTLIVTITPLLSFCFHRRYAAFSHNPLTLTLQNYSVFSARAIRATPT